MDDRAVLRERFGAFVRALEHSDLAVFDRLFTPETCFETEHLGFFTGTAEAVRRYTWPETAPGMARYRIYNSALLQEGDTAVQTAYVVALVGNWVDGYLHHFQFGGHYLLSWRRMGGGWRVERLKYSHDMECGNTALVAGWWRLPDYTLFHGYPEHPIDSRRDAPWRVLPGGCAGWSEEERIIDLFHRYAWGIDEDDFALTSSALAEDVSAKIPGSPISGRPALVELLKGKRAKEATMSHVGKLRAVEVRGDTGSLRIWRYEPHRIGTKILHAGNADTLFYSVDYEFHVRKTGGVWNIAQIDYRIGVFGAQDDHHRYQ